MKPTGTKMSRGKRTDAKVKAGWKRKRKVAKR
jgi:hypothetical protein